MPRSVKEWIGKISDTKAPSRVRQRIFDAAGGVCHICSLPIKTAESWHADHVIALIEGGENRETNLKPAHAHCNLAKANGEKTRKAKVQRTKEKYTGARQPKGNISNRGFDRKERAPKPDFTQRRPLYQEK